MMDVAESSAHRCDGKRCMSVSGSDEDRRICRGQEDRRAPC